MVIGPPFGNLFRRTTAVTLSALTLAMVLIAVSAFGPVSTCLADNVSKGSSSKKLKNQTIKSIPFEQLSEQARAKISDTLNKPSVYRRLPVTAINADPDYFRFLIRYPEVVVKIWQLMGVTKMTSERTGPYAIATNDGAGTISSLELVYGTDELHIFYGTGSYEGSFFKRKLTGSCVLVLRSQSQVGPDGVSVVTSQLDVFVKIDNAAAGLLAKTIHPIIGTTADHNFVESLKFVQRLNETTQKNGPGVQRMGQRLNLAPEIQQKLNTVVETVFQRAISGTTNRGVPGQPVPAFEALRDDRQNRRAIMPETGMQPSGYPQFQNPTFRARGYQSPVYSVRPVSTQASPPQTYARPVQATYDVPRQYLLAPPYPVKRAGWYQR